MTIAPARPDDLDAVVEFLEANRLPEAGLREHGARVFVAREGARLAGTSAIEAYGDVALLRSVAVDPGLRGTGLGRRLTQAALDDARAIGVRRVFLLTETAAEFFPRLGFARIDRERVPPAIRGTVEFASACPSSATVMVCDLTASSEYGRR